MNQASPTARKWIGLALFWIFSVSVAFWIGSSSDSDDEANPAGLGGASATEASSSARGLGTRRKGGKMETRRMKGPQLDAYSPSDLENPERLRNLDPGDYRQLLNRIGQEMEPGPQRSASLRKVLAAWATHDPEGAFDHADAIDEPKLRHDAKTEMLKAFAHSDPIAAWEFAKASTDGLLPDNKFPLLFEGMASADPNAVLQFISTYHEDLVAHGGSAIRMFDSLYENGGHSAMVPWSEALPPGPMRDGAINRIIDRWARYDPAAAKDWMERVVDNPENLANARFELAESWARVDPVAAIEWVGSLDQGDGQNRFFDAVLRRWLQYEPETATAWLSSNDPSPEFDRPIENYSRQLSRSNPEQAMDWTERITDEAARTRAVTRVAYEWRRRDPQGLQRFVRSGQFSEDEQRRLLGR